MSRDCSVFPAADPRSAPAAIRSTGLLVLFATLCLFLFLAPAQAAPVPLDRILAVVNDDIITLQELEEQSALTKARIRQEGGQLPEERLLRQKVLERMVYERLQVQRAAELGVVVSEEMIDRALQNVAAQNRMTVPEVLASLGDEGVSEELFRQRLKDQIAVQQVIEREIKSRVSVTDAEVDAVLDTIGQSSVGNAAYDLSHILIPIPDSATAADAEATLARASTLVNQIRQGQVGFAEASARYSRAPNALEGGRLGWKTADQLPTLFIEALRGMQPGQLSEPLRSPNGIHIILLHEVRGGDRQLARQTHARHILIRATTNPDIRAAQAKLQRLREQLLAGELDFAVVAREMSEDPGSAIRGGDLGWIDPGQTVPEFEQVMDSLAPGEISQPLVSPFGVHIIQLIERRDVDVSDAKRREEVRSQIAARKVEEQFDLWLRDLKAKAYIDYRIPLDEL